MILAIDQGTSGTTCLVVDGSLNVLGRGYAELAQHFPQPGWVEHDPEEIWQSVLQAAVVALDKARIGAGDLQAIGVTNQRETAVLWDRRTGRPVHRAIVWQDGRTADGLPGAAGGAVTRAHRPDAQPVLLGHEGAVAARPRRPRPGRASCSGRSTAGWCGG